MGMGRGIGLGIPRHSRGSRHRQRVGCGRHSRGSRHRPCPAEPSLSRQAMAGTAKALDRACQDPQPQSVSKRLMDRTPPAPASATAPARPSRPGQAMLDASHGEHLYSFLGPYIARPSRPGPAVRLTPASLLREHGALLRMERVSRAACSWRASLARTRRGQPSDDGDSRVASLALERLDRMLTACPPRRTANMRL